MTNSEQAIREFVDKWGMGYFDDGVDYGYKPTSKKIEECLSDLTALISEHYVSREEYEADIEFKVNGRSIKFSVYHNLPKTRGLSMDDAVTNWVYRTKKYTAKSLCRYIMDKETEFICMTEEIYKELTEGGGE